MKLPVTNVDRKKLESQSAAPMFNSKDQDGTPTTTEESKNNLFISQLQRTIEKQEETIDSLYRVIDSFHLIKELLVNDIKEYVYQSGFLDAELVDKIVKNNVKEKGISKIKKKFQYEVFSLIKDTIYFDKSIVSGVKAKISVIENKNLWDKKLDLLLHLFRITQDGIEREELEKTEATIRKLYSGNE